LFVVVLVGQDYYLKLLDEIGEEGILNGLEVGISYARCNRKELWKSMFAYSSQKENYKYILEYSKKKRKQPKY